MGRPPYFSPEEELKLLELAHEYKGFTCSQLALLFVERHASQRVAPSPATVWRTLRRHHYTFQRTKTPSIQPQPAQDLPRYQSHHRPTRCQGYPSDLTDTQWALVSDIIRQPGRRGPPPKTPRQHLNALLYMARTGCQWRYLPKAYGPWNSVAKTYYRWRDAGILEQLHESLRVDLRVAQDKDPNPSVVILDSQSVKTTEKGGREATMQVKK